MSAYRVEWPCCESVTITEGWEPARCPICYTPPMEAAAPDLYAALDATRSAVERFVTEEKRANRAPTGMPKRDKWASMLTDIDAALAKARGE